MFGYLYTHLDKIILICSQHCFDTDNDGMADDGLENARNFVRRSSVVGYE